MGRATQGVRLINLEKRNDQISSVCKVQTEDEEEETEMLSDGVAPVMDELEGSSDASVSESRDEETETNE